MLLLLLSSLLFELPSTYSPFSASAEPHLVILYVLCKAGFACFLCPLEIGHAHSHLRLFPDLSLLRTTRAFVSHYAFYYGIFHLVRNSKCVINPCNETMRQIDLVIEHITGGNKVFIIIFFNIEYLLNLYYILGNQKTQHIAPTLPLPSRSIYFKQESPKSHIIELSIPSLSLHLHTQYNSFIKKPEFGK